MLEDQLMFALMFPSSVSVALPVKLMLAPSTTAVPLAGAVISTVGGVLTMIVTVI